MTPLILTSGRQFKSIDELLNHTEELEETVLQLRKELGQVSSVDTLARLVARWRLTPLEARFLEHLYARAGRVSSKEAIMEALYGDRADEPGIKIVDVLACKVRGKLGDEAIVTEWARGYRLAAEAIEAVRELLGQPMAEVRTAEPAVKRLKRVNMQVKALEHMIAAGRTTSTELGKAIDSTGHQTISIICCLVKSGRAKAVDWFRGPDGIKRTIYVPTKVGLDYYNARTSAASA